MDQISWDANIPKPRPLVPYLCDSIPDAICDQIGSFRNWPDLKQWELDHNLPIVTVAARCQAWLFFGLLKILTTLNGERFEVRDFVTDLSHRKVVNTQGVHRLLNNVSKNVFVLEKESKTKEHVGRGVQLFDELKALLPEVVPWIIRTIQKHENGRVACNLWDFEIYNVFLSTFLLVEGVCDAAIDRHTIHTEAATCWCKPWTRLFGTSTQTLCESFTCLGHCISLFHRVDMSLLTACRALALPAEGSFDHTKCEKERCVSYNIDHKTYVPSHIRDCGRCWLLRIDTNTLDNIISQGSVPLVRSMLGSNNEINIEIVDGKNIRDFAAISHLWAGGLGNTKENAHYHCQLKQIHLDLAKLHQSVLSYNSIAGPIYYWLDALCIPVSNEVLKFRAIGTMAHIYAGSRTVLVIDPTLGSRRATDLNLYELDVAVLSSPWMARSWTLQEGALAINVIYRFADKLVSYEQLKFLGGRTKNTLIQSLWSRDVDRIIPRKHHDFVLDLLYACLHLVPFFTHFFDDNHGTSVAHSAFEVETFSRDAAFVTVWNELARRSTSESADIVTILGTLMDCSAAEILDLGEDERLLALLGAQQTLPSGLLFAPDDPKSPTWSPRPPGGGHRRSHLQFTGGTMELLPSGIFRIDHLKSMYVLRSHQQILLSREAYICVPASKMYFRIKFDDKSYTMNSTTKTDIVLLFNQTSHGETRRSNGKCFVLTKASEDGLCLQYMGSFTYQYLGHDRARRRVRTFFRFNAFDFFEIHAVSTACPLLIDMCKHYLCIRRERTDMKLVVKWPQLRWSRSRFYPFAANSRWVGSWLLLFDYVFVFIVVPTTFTVLGTQFSLTSKAPTGSSASLMILIAGLAFLVVHQYLLYAEYVYVWSLTNQNLQRRWAASFLRQINVSESDSRSARYMLLVISYAVLLVATYVPTAIMLLQLPAVQAICTTDLEWSLLFAAFKEILFDLSPDGRPRPWYTFVVRYACRIVCIELLIRAIVMCLMAMTNYYQVLSMPQEFGRNSPDTLIKKFQARWGASNLCTHFILIPGSIWFSVFVWWDSISNGLFELASIWCWDKMITLFLLFYSTYITIEQVIVGYGPTARHIVRSMRGHLAAAGYTQSSRTYGRGRGTDYELISRPSYYVP